MSWRWDRGWGEESLKKTPLLPSGSLGVRMLWPGRQVPLNVYEQNICGQIPQRRWRGGEMESRSQRSKASTFRKVFWEVNLSPDIDVVCLFFFLLPLPLMSTVEGINLWQGLIMSNKKCHYQRLKSCRFLSWTHSFEGSACEGMWCHNYKCGEKNVWFVSTIPFLAADVYTSLPMTGSATKGRAKVFIV